MSEWIRLYIVVEGVTEKEFIDKVIAPHLHARNIKVISKIVLTNRKLNKRGGIVNFDHIRNDLERYLKHDSHPHARFTTMIDFYGLPKDFPGWDIANKVPQKRERIETLEASFGKVIQDCRLIPHIQLHEFETLLYCDLQELQYKIPDSQRQIVALTQEVSHMEPEEIDDGNTTAPSKRLIKHLPVYETSKVRVGASAAISIGLGKMRAMCPHFDAWIAKLEQLNSS